MKIYQLISLTFLLMLTNSTLAQETCAPDQGMNFICEASNPEDLVQVPDTSYIISSGMADGAGFYLIDSQTDTLSLLSFKSQHDAAAFPACDQAPAPQSLNTHGLGIRATGANQARLYVVGHGAREAIEIFTVDSVSGKPELAWIGCVLMPEGLAANSVAASPDGSILATVLFMPGTTFADAIVDRSNTGAVFEWKPGQTEFTLIQGSELPANNGIEISTDGSEFYVASSGLQTIVAFSYSNPARQLRSTPPLGFTPDNVHMGSDGLLYTAGMANDVPECGGAPGKDHDIAILSACPRGTIAVAIPPDSMQVAVILQTGASGSFSNATMVLPVGDQLWIGSFSSDRIARAARQ